MSLSCDRPIRPPNSHFCSRFPRPTEISPLFSFFPRSPNSHFFSRFFVMKNLFFRINFFTPYPSYPKITVCPIRSRHVHLVDTRSTENSTPGVLQYLFWLHVHNLSHLVGSQGGWITVQWTINSKLRLDIILNSDIITNQNPVIPDRFQIGSSDWSS